jgi:predicted secreted protein
VALRVGDVLAVELPENPTTGYLWSVAVDVEAGS